MEHKPKTTLPPLAPTCVRRRIAESGQVAVDACDCGMLHLHLGAITLRLEKGVMQTLSQVAAAALAANDAELQSAVRSIWGHPGSRGEA